MVANLALFSEIANQFANIRSLLLEKLEQSECMQRLFRLIRISENGKFHKLFH